MFCGKCGTKNKKGDIFCMRCGLPLTQAKNAPAPNQPMPNQLMPNQPMINQPMPNQPMPSQPMPSQPMLNQPMPNQPMLNQPMLNQPMPNQPMLNQPVTNQPMPNQPMPNQLMPNQPMPNQPVPNQLMPNQPGKNGAGKKKKKPWAMVLVAMIAVIAVICASQYVVDNDTTDVAVAENEPEEKPTEVMQGTPSADDDVTVLVYMIASSLEYDDEKEKMVGAASSDIQEMVSADLSNKVNVVLETGGTKAWNNKVLTPGAVDRCVIKDGNIKVVEQMGKICMTETSALTDFINWGVKNYPAKRYQIIFWDHGGGVVSGFGDDRNFSGSKGLLLSEMKKAIEDSGVHFELLCFDACLMATVEAANAFSGCVDYMVASEENENATGHNYKNYFNTLSENTEISTEDLGIAICENYTFDDAVNNMMAERMTSTLSLVKLSEVPLLITAIGDYFKSLNTAIKSSQGFSTVYAARYNALNFSANEMYKDYGSLCDEIDLMDFIGNIDPKIADRTEITRIFKRVVKYNGTFNGVNATKAHGLSIYIPGFRAFYDKKSAANELRAEGITDSNYITFISNFAEASTQQIAKLIQSEQSNSEESGAVATAESDSFWSGYTAYYNYSNGGLQLASSSGKLAMDDSYIVDLESSVGGISNVADAAEHVYWDFGMFYLGLGQGKYDVLENAAGKGVEYGGVSGWYSIDDVIVSCYHMYVEGNDGEKKDYIMIPAETKDGEEIFLIGWYEDCNIPTMYGYCLRSGYSYDKTTHLLTSLDSAYIAYPALDLNGNLIKFIRNKRLIKFGVKSVALDFKYMEMTDTRLMSYLEIIDKDGNNYCTEGIYTVSDKISQEDVNSIYDVASSFDAIIAELAELYDSGKVIPDDKDAAADYHQKLQAARVCAKYYLNKSNYSEKSGVCFAKHSYILVKMMRGILMDANAYGYELDAETLEMLKTLDVDAKLKELFDSFG